jgi:hypothetical protein
MASNPSTFSKFGKNAAAQPAATPEPEATKPVSTALSLFGKAGATSALMAVTDQSDGGGQKSPFPIIQVTGGASGGLFGAVKGTADQEVLDMLPQGGKPVKGIFLAYRSEILAWPAAFVEGQENHSNPSWTGVIPAGAVADAQLAFKACEAYQFTPKAEKAKFDYAASEIGHIRPSLQLLVFLAEINDVAIVQVPAYFSSWIETQKSLRLLVDPETKQLGQFPCCIRVITNEVQNKARTQNWKVHHCDITQAVDAVTKTAWEKYQPWVAALQETPEKMALFQEWLDGSDRLFTDTMRSALRKATAI